MVARGVSTSASTRIRPREVLLRNLLLSAIIGGVPLFGVLFWLSITQGSWIRVLVVFAGFIAAVLVTAARHQAVFVVVTATTITKQAFARRTVVQVSDVATTSIGHTYRGSSSETLPQFIATGADGQVIFRLGGLFWSEDDMEKVATAIGARKVLIAEPMTLKEFYALAPGAAYWYEGKPWVGVLGIVVAFLAALAIVWWLMSAIGVPLALGPLAR